MVLDINDIQKILPHRPPMLLVDRIIELEPFKSATGIKNVTMNEPHFLGHFPGHPIMPGVLILEAMAQVGGVAMLYPEEHRGVITKREPTAEERKDMEFGFRMAKEIGRLDVGQTAVVKNMAVMALEAIEGTDACIHRGGELARGGAVVAKVAKPQQDDRFDVPTVGLATIQSMVDVGATALAIEADKTLLVEREEMLALAEANNITIAAL